MDAQRIANLRREIEGIHELNRLDRLRKGHSPVDRILRTKRLIRLEEIKHELAALRKKES
jgi:hypothetical protein